MKIRKADKKDAGVLKGLWIKSLENEKKLNSDIDLESEIKDFKKSFPKLFRENNYFLAEEGGKVVGFIGGKIKIGSGFYKNVKIGKINVLFVEKKCRNKGVGTELIKIFVSWLKTKKAEIAELDVSSNNTAAIKLYKNLGFKEFITQMRKKI